MRNGWIGLLIILVIGLTEYFFKFPLWKYRNGAALIDSWTCKGKEITLYCSKRDPLSKLLPVCNYLCIGRSIHKTADEVLNELDFYKDSHGFRDIFD